MMEFFPTSYVNCLRKTAGIFIYERRQAVPYTLQAGSHKLPACFFSFARLTAALAQLLQTVVWVDPGLDPGDTHQTIICEG